MEFREPIKRSTLADAIESRVWHIYANFAQALIRLARKLYASDPLNIELSNTVYALDSTMIDRCLSIFPWALFRSAKAAVKIHTLLDLRGNIPNFFHLSDGKLHDVHVGCSDLLGPCLRDRLHAPRPEQNNWQRKGHASKQGQTNKPSPVQTCNMPFVQQIGENAH